MWIMNTPLPMWNITAIIAVTGWLVLSCWKLSLQSQKGQIIAHQQHVAVCNISTVSISIIGIKDDDKGQTINDYIWRAWEKFVLVQTGEVHLPHPLYPAMYNVITYLGISGKEEALNIQADDENVADDSIKLTGKPGGGGSLEIVYPC